MTLIQKEANTLRKLKSTLPEQKSKTSKSPEKSVEAVSICDIGQRMQPLIKDKIPHFTLRSIIGESKDQRRLNYISTKVCSLQPIKPSERQEQLIQEIDMCTQKFDIEKENSFSKKTDQQLTFSSFYHTNTGFYNTRGKME